VLKALAFHPARHARFLVIGDHAVFAHTAKVLRRRLPGWPVRRLRSVWQEPNEPVTLLDCGRAARFMPGRPTAASGRAALAYLDAALALHRAGRIQALVTAPVTKWAIERSGCPFKGQTEYLARALRCRDVAMMFVSDSLRVVLSTRHLPLREVPRAVSRRLVRTTVRLTADALKRLFGVRRPRLAICGLNPHAGELGLFGTEERQVLLPALRTLRTQGFVCEGPFAADGLFARLAHPARGHAPYDAVICWYHDQGLIPFKMATGHRGCQLSVGLPLVRTSPDHGSALDIAGRGLAHPGSMRYALELAARLVRRA
jgi:4-hydroxythreonine-4-phosphate dehydrogenase